MGHQNAKPENHKGDPGRFSQIVQLRNYGHWSLAVNVIDINIARGRPPSCQAGFQGPLGGTRRRIGQPQAAQVDKDGRLQEIIGWHRRRITRAVAATKQRGDAVGECPDVQRHHQHRRAVLGRHGASRAARLRAAKRRRRAPPRPAAPGLDFKRKAGFEHGCVIGWLAARELQVGLSQPIECCKRRRTPLVPGPRQWTFEELKAATRDVDQELVAIAKVPIGRRGAHPGKASGLGKGEAGRPLFRDQLGAPRGSAPP